MAEGFDVHNFIAHRPRWQVYDVQLDAAPVIRCDASVSGSDDALALAFTRCYYHDWRYVAWWGRWLVWDGRRWRLEHTLAATDLTRQVCRQVVLQVDSPRSANRQISAVTINGVERLAQRFICPYCPGNGRINGRSAPPVVAGAFTVSWTTRNRCTQKATPILAPRWTDHPSDGSNDNCSFLRYIKNAGR